MIDEKHEFGREILNLPGNLCLHSYTEGKANNIRRPTHQLLQIFIRLPCLVGIDGFGQTQKPDRDRADAASAMSFAERFLSKRNEPERL